jgi:hypothetical protein
MRVRASTVLVKWRGGLPHAGRMWVGALCVVLAVCVTAQAQETTSARPAAPDEADVVKRVVETYLYAEEPDEKKSPLHKEAKIYSFGPGNRMNVTPFSKPARRREGKSSRSPQRVVSVDVAGDSATVKVLTDFAPDDPKAGDAAKHYQYLWLMKLNGEWKIIAALMSRVTWSPASRP